MTFLLLPLPDLKFLYRGPTAISRLSLLLPCLFLLCSCLSLRYIRENKNKPPPKDSLALLLPGKSTLADCLSQLGAPTLVQKEREGGGPHLLYVWSSESSWSIGLSFPLLFPVLPFSDNPGKLSYGDENLSNEKLWLEFDRNLILTKKR